jgi:hypothetical protein
MAGVVDLQSLSAGLDAALGADRRLTIESAMLPPGLVLDFTDTLPGRQILLEGAAVTRPTANAVEVVGRITGPWPLPHIDLISLSDIDVAILFRQDQAAQPIAGEITVTGARMASLQNWILLSGTVQPGGSVALQVSPQNNLSPSVALSDVVAVVTASRLADMAPQGVALFEQVPISAVALAFGFAADAVTAIDLTIVINAVWSIIGSGLFALANPKIRLSARHTPRPDGGEVRIRFAATLAATTTIAGAQFEIALDLSDEDILDFAVLPKDGQPLPGLMDLAEAVGGDALKSAVAAGIQALGLGDLTVDGIEVGFSVSAQRLTRVSLSSHFSLAGGRIDTVVQLLPNFVFYGSLATAAKAAGPTPSGISLDALATRVLGSAADLPPLVVTELSLFADPQLGTYSIAVATTEDWSWDISGHGAGPSLILQGIGFDAEKSPQDIEGALYLMLALSGFKIGLSAQYRGSGAGWLLTGSGADSDGEPLATFLRDLAQKLGAALPDDLVQAVPDIRLVAVQVIIDTHLKSFQFSCDTRSTDTIPLGLKNYEVELRASLASAPDPASGTRTLSGHLEADLEIGEAAFVVAFDFGAVKVVTGRWTGGGDLSLGLADIAAALGIEHTLSLPAYLDLGLKSASFEYHVDNRDYEQGFHLTAEVEILGCGFTLAANMGEGQGLSGTAAKIGSIDLDFVTFVAPHDGVAGPQVAVKAFQSQTQFELGFGFDLFGLHFRNCKLSYAPQTSTLPERFTGSVELGETVQLLGPDRPRLDVEWTGGPDGGFKVLNWPITADLLKVQKRLKALFEALDPDSRCQALGALGVDENFFKGECRSKIRLAKAPPPESTQDPPAVLLDADISYEIWVESFGKRYTLDTTAIPLRDLKLTLPASPSPADLVDAIERTVLANIESIVLAIFQNPQALARMCEALAIEAIKRLPWKALIALVCRGVPDPRLGDELNRRLVNPVPPGDDDPDDNDGDRKLEDAERILKTLLGAGTLAAMMMLAEEVYAAAAAAVTFFAHLLEVLEDLASQIYETEAHKQTRLKKERAEKAADDARQAIKTKLNIPAGGEPPHYAGAGVTFAWPKVEGAEEYLVDVTIQPPEGPKVTSKRSSLQPRTEVTDVAIVPGALVQVRVIARAGDYEGVEWRSEIRIKDYGARKLTGEQIGPDVAVSWESGPDPVSGWSVSAIAPGRAAIPRDLPADARTWELTAQQVPGGAVYTISVTPKGPSYTVAAATTMLPVSTLSAATNVQGFFDDDARTIDVTWDAVAGAVGYRIQIVLADGHLLQLAKDDIEVPNQATFHDASFTADQQVHIRVGTLAPVIAGSDVRPVVWTSKLPFTPASHLLPVISAMVYEAPDVVARWTAVANASGYNAALFDGSGGTLTPNPVAIVVTQAPPGTPDAELALYPMARFTGQFADQQVVTIKVRARDATSAGAWSNVAASEDAATRLRIRVIPAPRDVTPTNRDETVEVSWQAVTEATDGYQVSVLSAEGAALSPQPTVTFPSVTAASIAAEALQEGSSYQVAVRAKAPRSLSVAAVETIVRTPQHPEQLARRLHSEGVIAPVAAPLIRTAFPDKFVDGQPAAMVDLLRSCFPESAATPTQLAWAVSAADYPSASAAPAVLTALQGSASVADVMAALKGAYPPPGLAAAIAALVTGHAAAPAAAARLAVEHPDLTALQLGLVLAMRFSDTVQTPSAMAAALLQGAFPAAQASAGIHELFPSLALAPDIDAAIVAVFPATQAAYADALRTQALTAQQAAWRIGRMFGHATPAADLLTLLTPKFPQSMRSPAQKAWALADAGYDAAAAAAALQSGGLPLADVAAAVKALYPPPSTVAQIEQLQGAGTPAAQAAVSLRSAHPDLTALELGLVLVRNIPDISDAVQLAGALKQAGYLEGSVGPVLSELIPLLSLADVAAALRATFHP